MREYVWSWTSQSLWLIRYGFMIKVEFESLHLICSECGCYGLVARNCVLGVKHFNLPH